MIEEILYCPHIRCNSVFCQISFGEIAFEFCYHIILIYNEYGNNIIEYIGHYTQLPEGWQIASMQTLCNLTDGEKQLKIKYDPKVSSFKDTILESKTDTIGGQYPFFFRNGWVRYKEIPISGLISY